MTNPTQDYYAWTQETIEKLRQGRFSDVNMDDLIEELEDMGKSERHQLVNRLSVLLAHLLKWQYQPERQSKSWRLTIKHQWLKVQDVLKANPSLKPRIPEFSDSAYKSAVVTAALETDREEDDFPATFELNRRVGVGSRF